MIKILFTMTVAMGVSFGALQAQAKGAIAINQEFLLDTETFIGTGSTHEEASRAALAACMKNGANGCKIAVTYDTCGAYAESVNAMSVYPGVGLGKSETVAKANALKACQDQKCKVLISDCQ